MNQSNFQAQIERAAPTASEAIDLRYYWRIIYRFKYGIVAMGIVAAVVSSMFAARQPDVYDATATLLIEQAQSNVVSIQEIYNLSGSDTDYMETQSEMLRNRSLAERVIRDLNLLSHPVFESSYSSSDSSDSSGLGLVEEAPPEGWIDQARGLVSAIKEKAFPARTSASNENSNFAAALTGEEMALARAINRLHGMMDITILEWTNLVEIQFTGNDAQLTAELANSLAENFIEFTLEQRMEASADANQFLTGGLQSLRDTLNASEQRLQDFMEREGLVDVDGVGSINTIELNELSGQSAGATQRRSEAEARYNQVKDLTPADWRRALSIPAILADEAILNLKENSDAIDRRIAELSNRYGRRHPTMISLRSEQATMAQNLEAQVAVVLESVENEYLSARDVERNIVASIDERKGAVQDINRKSFTLRELQREVDTNRELYDLFFTRIRETDETADYEASNIMIVDPAVPALGPSGPNRRLQVNIATLAAVMLAMLLALLRDAMDNTLNTVSDVEERLKTEVLGVVPKTKDLAYTGEKLAFLGFEQNPHSSFAESFRTIRTGIMLSSLEAPAKVIVVASTLSGEGKTTVAFNLAAATSQTGKTLIIDGDLRRPSIARSLGVDPDHLGITDMLADRLPLEKCILPYKDTDIWIMPHGRKVTNPLEIIASKKFGKLIAALATKFDTVIIDTPPINSVSDALVISHLADQVVYVVKAGSTQTKDVRNSLQRLRASHAHQIGVVLNLVDPNGASYYGDNEYYGGYYNTNVYGEEVPVQN